MTHEDQQQIRERVSKAYSAAVSGGAASGQSCCGTQPKGVAARLAGYRPDELGDLPADAVTNSFGCGNPVAFAEVREGDVVVDLGAGAGMDLLLAARKVGASGKVIGVDMTEDMLAAARRNMTAAGVSNVEVRKGCIEDLPIESESVDWAISNCVINLSPDKPRVFAEIARILRPGGRMLVSDIVVRDLPEWVRRDETLYCSCVAGAISEEEYIEGLRQAGLADVEVRDRLIYEVSQLESLIRSDLPEVSQSVERRGCDAGPFVHNVAQSLAGRMWSISVFARKPA